MDVFSEGGLKAQGFVGFVNFQSLDLTTVPEAEGVYILLRDTDDPPQFLDSSPGGWFKGNDPTEEVVKLKAKWVEGARVINIGKASKTKRRNLRRRITEYRRFGLGERIAHWGGRYVWQCSDSAHYLICWKEVPQGTALNVERELRRKFKATYGKLPFGNHH